MRDASSKIEILLNFSASDDLKYQNAAFWALKDYVMLNVDKNLVSVPEIVQAFLHGSIS